jgi:hypothetical protein
LNKIDLIYFLLFLKLDQYEILNEKFVLMLFLLILHLQNIHINVLIKYYKF